MTFNPGDEVNMAVTLRLIRPLANGEKIPDMNGNLVEVFNFRSTMWWAEFNQGQPPVLICVDGLQSTPK